MARERVVVLIPFGARSKKDTRRASLEYMRVRHLLGKPEVGSSFPPVERTCEVANQVTACLASRSWFHRSLGR